MIRLILLLSVCFYPVLSQWELCKSFTQQCEKDEFQVGNKRMVLFSREKNWRDAMADCERVGMRLLTTESKSEVDQLNKYLQTRIWGTGRPDVYHWNLWLAANNIDSNGIWTWKTTGHNLSYTSWGPGEPNGGDPESCLELNLIYFDESHWNDVRCQTKKRYICENEDGGLK